MDTLSRELRDSVTEEGVFSRTHVHHTDFNKGVHIQNILAAAEWSTQEDLVTKLLKTKFQYDQFSQMLFLGFAVATFPVWGSQP